MSLLCCAVVVLRCVVLCVVSSCPPFLSFALNPSFSFARVRKPVKSSFLSRLHIEQVILCCITGCQLKFKFAELAPKFRSDARSQDIPVEFRRRSVDGTGA